MMREITKQKIALATESVKQLITLSSAILTLTIAFKEKIIPDEIHSSYWLLVLALTSQIVSVFYGVHTIQGFVNVLEIASDDDDVSVLIPMIQDPALAQVRAFMVGLGLLVAYLVVSLIFAK